MYSILHCIEKLYCKMQNKSIFTGGERLTNISVYTSLALTSLFLRCYLVVHFASLHTLFFPSYQCPQFCKNCQWCNTDSWRSVFSVCSNTLPHVLYQEPASLLNLWIATSKKKHLFLPWHTEIEAVCHKHQQI